MKSGQLLEIVLDDGEPIENVPRSVILEGHKVLKQERNGEHWNVMIEKA
jgi:TusA-related sulfurtransferase